MSYNFNHLKYLYLPGSISTMRACFPIMSYSGQSLMAAAFRDSISAHTLIPNVLSSPHIFLAKAALRLIFLMRFSGKSTGMISDDLDCKNKIAQNKMFIYNDTMFLKL